jgi:hypothetical protein
LILPLIGIALPLTEWLSNLSLGLRDLPPLSHSLPQGWQFLLDISSAQCSGFSLHELHVDHATASRDSLSARVSVEGLGVKCHVLANASIHRYESKLGTGPIKVEFLLVDSSLSAALQILLSNDTIAPLPKKAELITCSTVLNLFKLEFFGMGPAGMVVAKLLNLLRPLIEDQHLLNSALCAGTSAFATGWISSALQNLSDAVVRSEVLLPGKPLPEPELSPAATHMDALLTTGVIGHVLQTLLRDVLHVYNSSEFTRVLQKAVAAVHPRSPLPRSLNASTQLPFGRLSVDVALPKCSSALESPIATGRTTHHVVELASGVRNLSCGIDPKLVVTFTSGSVHAGTLDMSIGMFVAVQRVSMHIMGLLGLDLKRGMHDYELDQLQHSGCAVHVLDSEDPPSVAVLDLKADVQSVVLQAWGRDRDQLSDQLLRTFGLLSTVVLTAAQPALSLFLNGRGIQHLREKMNTGILNWTVMHPPCPPTIFGTGVYQPAATTSYVVTGTFFVVGAMASVWVCLWVPCLRIFGIYWAPIPVPCPQNSPDHQLECAPSSYEALSSHAMLSRTTSWAVTLLTLGNIGLFFVSDFAGQINMAVIFKDSNPVGGGPHAQYDTRIMDFTMYKICETFYKSGCYPLLVLVVLWSVLWPVIKLLMMLVCWHMPAPRLPTARRGQILNFLAHIGKLSLFDPFLFVIFLAGFQFSYNNDNGVGGGKISLMIGGVQCWGFYCLFLGTVASLAIGECMLEVHRRAQREEECFVQNVSSTVSSMLSHNPSFARSLVRSSLVRSQHNLLALQAIQELPDPGGESCLPTPSTQQRSLSGSLGHSLVGVSKSGVGAAPRASSPVASSFCGGPSSQLAVPMQRIVKRSRTKRFITWMIITSFPALTILGVCCNSFSLDFRGAVGMLRAITNHPLSRYQSVLLMPLQLFAPPDGNMMETGMLVLLMGLFAWFVIVAPVLHGVCLIVYWAMPLTPKAQYRCTKLSHFLHSWSALDVFCISLGFAILGGEKFGIESFISSVVTDGTIAPFCNALSDKTGVHCIAFTVKYHVGGYILISAAVMQIISSLLLGRQIKMMDVNQEGGSPRSSRSSRGLSPFP